MTQRGLEEVIARRVAAEKATWISEQQEIRRDALKLQVVPSR